MKGLCPGPLGWGLCGGLVTLPLETSLISRFTAYSRTQKCGLITEDRRISTAFSMKVQKKKKKKKKLNFFKAWRVSENHS
jgi:hypothetical protein